MTVVSFRLFKDLRLFYSEGERGNSQPRRICAVSLCYNEALVEPPDSSSCLNRRTSPIEVPVNRNILSLRMAEWRTGLVRSSDALPSPASASPQTSLLHPKTSSPGSRPDDLPTWAPELRVLMLISQNSPNCIFQDTIIWQIFIGVSLKTNFGKFRFHRN